MRTPRLCCVCGARPAAISVRSFAARRPTTSCAISRRRRPRRRSGASERRRSDARGGPLLPEGRALAVLHFGAEAGGAVGVVVEAELRVLGDGDATFDGKQQRLALPDA